MRNMVPLLGWTARLRYRIVLAEREAAERIFDARFAEYPGDEGVAVGPRPVPVGAAIKIAVGPGENFVQPVRFLAAPFRDEPRRAAADVGFRSLQIAVQVADAAAARVHGLPHLPAIAALSVAYHEPVVRRNPTEEGNACPVQTHARF